MSALRALSVVLMVLSVSCTARQPGQPPTQVATDAPPPAKPAAAVPEPGTAPAAVPPPAGAAVPSSRSAPESCPPQRPEICTQEYRPVCASVDTGVRCIKAPCPSAEQKEFSNWCVACTNPKVTAYVNGPCPGGGPRPSPESMPQ